MPVSTVVSDKAKRWSRPRGEPQVEVSVVIPVDRRDAAAVVEEVEPGNSGDVGEPSLPGVEEAAVSFMAAPRTAGLNQSHDLRPAGAVLIDGHGVVGRHGRVRQDLPPEEASQIFRLMPGHKPVRNDQVFPAVVVNVDEL